MIDVVVGDDDEDETEQDEEEVGESRDAAAGSAKPTSGAKKTGHKLCKWSWKEKQCTPTALCQYKYQVRVRAGGGS